jgi:hypothetical protein
MVLTLEDCLALCELSEEEVLAIAEHERIPELAAAELGSYLARTAGGELAIKAMIRDDLAAARARGDVPHAAALKLVLRNFVLQHPRCEARHRALLHSPERRVA